MKFNTAFLELVQKHAYRQGGEAERILRTLIEYRLAHGLDEKYKCDDPLRYDDATLDREIEKLATVFEAINSRSSERERREMIELLKEEYSCAEVQEIVDEYFPELRMAATRPTMDERVTARP